jgi:hypothetical protein
MKNKTKKFLIKSFAKNILYITQFRRNSIGDEGAKEVAQGLKAFINLNFLTIDLRYKRDPLGLHLK